jgi:hypothetical protein
MPRLHACACVGACACFFPLTPAVAHPRTQGTDSMYPYQLNDGTWAALVGTSHQETPDPWPQPGGGKWPVSLATAPTIAGPWTRRNPGGAPADAPCVDLNGGFSENPIVSRRQDNSSQFQVVIDALNAERCARSW